MGNSLKFWRIADSYIQGKGHELKNIPCQDRTYSLEHGNTSIISLSDGAGSCQFSHYGAEVATIEICNILKDKFEIIYEYESGKAVKLIISGLIDKFRLKADELGVSIKDLSSTLMFASVKNGKYIVGHIGDGVIGILKNGDLTVLSEPNNKEYINVTTFITSSDVYKDFMITKGELFDIEGFLLMSDGAAQSLYERREKKISPAAKQMMEWLDDNLISDVKDALRENIEKYLKPKTTDDCSVNILRLTNKKIEDIYGVEIKLQKEFLRIGDKRTEKYISNYINILQELSFEPVTQKQIAEKIGLKDIRYYIDELEKGNFAAKDDKGRLFLK